ncbi:hypothetical protein [Micromonospora mirobrigensis]|uniref:Uncharacterized protein n=1 Tax=Micromonospora mirobrigensis TaxID=262898 RepID=A0A1C4XEB6_9ACTN|nr:hypothetical protein [Micromonospora mirobrigensis]SCF06632.1 hypothetical protein GA0070564_10320 [Micromonospora mirobrigensis]
MGVVDTFGRSVTGGWGTSDSGSVWAVSTVGGGSSADFNVGGFVSGKGTHSHGGTNRYMRSVVASANIQDPDQVMDLAIYSPFVTGAAVVMGVVGRYQDANNYYWLRTEFNAGSSNIQLKISKVVGGTDTQIANVNPLPGLSYGLSAVRMRARIIDDMLQIKAWPASGSEPASWNLTAYDSTFSAAGGVGIQSWVVGGNTNSMPFPITYDNYNADENITPVVLSAVAQDVWPTRVLVSLTGITVGSSVALYRVVGGERTLVRAGIGSTVTDKSFLRVDAELPFGEPVSYVAVVNGTTEYTTAPVTYALDGGKVAVTDAITGNAAEVVITAWDEKSYERQSSVFKVGGRNVVVSGDIGMFEGDIELLTETDSARENLTELLTNATEGAVQIRQPGGYAGVDSYAVVTRVAERRFSQDGSDQRRYFTLSVAEVESWAPAMEARGFTLQDIANAYTGLVLADIAADYATLLDIAQGDFS